jgi:hypothetical protein
MHIVLIVVFSLLFTTAHAATCPPGYKQISADDCYRYAGDHGPAQKCDGRCQRCIYSRGAKPGEVGGPAGGCAKCGPQHVCAGCGISLSCLDTQLELYKRKDFLKPPTDECPPNCKVLPHGVWKQLQTQ